MSLNELRRDAQVCVDEFFASAGLKDGAVIAVGCSTSAVQGKSIGSSGSADVAAVLYDVLMLSARQNGVFLTFQCCEHLNRAIVLEAALAERLRCDLVSVVPQPHAGGALASHAWKELQQPVVVEFIKADAGVDIGGVLIGMHIRHVAVPLKLTNNRIGSAVVTAAKSRPKLIGGARARYE